MLTQNQVLTGNSNDGSGVAWTAKTCSCPAPARRCIVQDCGLLCSAFWDTLRTPRRTAPSCRLRRGGPLRRLQPAARTLGGIPPAGSPSDRRCDSLHPGRPPLPGVLRNRSGSRSGRDKNEYCLSLPAGHLHHIFCFQPRHGHRATPLCSFSVHTASTPTMRLRQGAWCGSCAGWQSRSWSPSSAPAYFPRVPSSSTLAAVAGRPS